MAESKHPWRFHRAGGLDQVFLESADDFRHIGELDPKVWVALACPVDGLEFDKDTLKLIDTDGDGRIRQPEVVEAVGFAVARLIDPGELVKCSGVLQLSAIKQDDEGKLITSAARRALTALGKPDAPSISVEEAVNSLGAVPKLKHNGDGVVPPASADDDATKAVIEDILKTVGGVADRSGDQGVDAALQIGRASCRERV